VFDVVVVDEGERRVVGDSVLSVYDNIMLFT